MEIVGEREAYTQRAREPIKPFVSPVACGIYGDAIRPDGNSVYLKLENLQSFGLLRNAGALRGCRLTLTDEERGRGGGHRRFGGAASTARRSHSLAPEDAVCPCAVGMSLHTPLIKVSASSIPRRRGGPPRLR